MIGNPEARIAKGALVVMLLFTALIFLPSWVGMDMMRGGYALGTLSFFFALAAGVTALVFWRRARMLDDFLGGRHVLARWDVPPDIWLRHVAADLVEEQRDKKRLFGITAFWVVVIGAGFWIADPDAGRWVALVLVCVLALLVPFAFLFPRWRAARLRRRAAAVVIGRHGAFVGGELHDWKLIGSCLTDVEIDEKADPKLLRVGYMYVTGRGAPMPVEVRIPIPPEAEERAREAAGKLLLERKKRR